MVKRPDGWPALSSKLPKAHHAEANYTDTGDRRCYICGDPAHIAPNCPLKDKLKELKDEKSEKPTVPAQQNPPGDNKTPPPPPNVLKAATWRYIRPADENQKIVIPATDGANEKTFWWCSKCRCRKTGAVGYYTGHSTSHHKDSTPGQKKEEKPAETSDSASANLSPSLDPDPDGLEFEGAYLAEDGGEFG